MLLLSPFDLSHELLSIHEKAFCGSCSLRHVRWRSCPHWQGRRQVTGSGTHPRTSNGCDDPRLRPFHSRGAGNARGQASAQAPAIRHRSGRGGEWFLHIRHVAGGHPILREWRNHPVPISGSAWISPCMRQGDSPRCFQSQGAKHFRTQCVARHAPQRRHDHNQPPTSRGIAPIFRRLVPQRYHERIQVIARSSQTQPRSFPG
jgi:hypothetical protein